MPAHWTAKCYEFDNKEARNGTKIHRTGGSPNNAALIIERGHRPLPAQSGHRELASSMSVHCHKLKTCTATNTASYSITWSVRASGESGKVMPSVSRESTRDQTGDQSEKASLLSRARIRPTSMPSRRYDSSPVVDVLIVAEVATACGLRTVRVGKPGGARDGGLSAWAAPVYCGFMAPGGSRRHGSGADNNGSGKRYFDEHLHLRVWSG